MRPINVKEQDSLSFKAIGVLSTASVEYGSAVFQKAELAISYILLFSYSEHKWKGIQDRPKTKKITETKIQLVLIRFVAVVGLAYLESIRALAVGELGFKTEEDIEDMMYHVNSRARCWDWR
ncbi:hypothetical protein J6590_034370 [Homalodisca vitripennis]|nr:hypothetical protein J6590_034370 [Homalodisca vitripennis]